MMTRERESGIDERVRFHEGAVEVDAEGGEGCGVDFSSLWWQKSPFLRLTRYSEYGASPCTVIRPGVGVMKVLG